jgi:hypothetical protein
MKTGNENENCCLYTESSGHVWGDRYWSRVLEGEPPDWAEKVDWEVVDAAAETGVLFSGACLAARGSPLTTEKEVESGFSPEIPLRPPSPPTKALQSVRLAAKTRCIKPQ